MSAFIMLVEANALDEFTIPTIGSGYNYTVDWEKVDDPTVNGQLLNQTGNATITFPGAGDYRVSISGSFPRIYFNNGGDRLFLKDIEQWGTQAWISFNRAFFGCANALFTATDVPDLSSVADMSVMFTTAGNANPDVSGWDVSNVVNMVSMFYLATGANPDVSGWDVSNVENMNSMFRETTTANPDVSAWNTAKVTNMFRMFLNAASANPDISGWQLPELTTAVEFAQNSSFSSENYNSFLLSASKQNLKNNVPFHAGTAQVRSDRTGDLATDPAVAKAYIASNFLWKFTDGGTGAPYPFKGPGSEIPADLLGYLRAPARAEHVRVILEESNGTYRNLCTLEGIDWVRDVDLSVDIDSPIANVSINLLREDYQKSLVPYQLDSKLQSVIALNKRFRIDVSITLEGETPAYDSWVTLFRGNIDSISWEPEITIDALDLAGQLQRGWIETDGVYGSPSGTDVEDLIIQLLDEHAPAGWDDLFVCPVSPDWKVLEYSQDKMPIWQALQNIVAQFGWCIAYRWYEPVADFRLILFDPERENTTPRHYITPSQYLNVSSIGISIEHIRNAISGVYFDQDDLDESGDPKRKRIIIPDDLPAGNLKTKLNNSIDNYGRIFMEITEGADSLIDTESEMLLMLEYAAKDLCEPKIDKGIVMPLFPFVQVTDLLEFEANNIHFSNNQNLAIVSINQRLSNGSSQTSIQVRGEPCSMYMGWIERGAGPGMAPSSPIAPIDTITPIWEPIPGGLRIDIPIHTEIPRRLRERFDVFELHTGDGDFTPTIGTLISKGRNSYFDLLGSQLPIGESKNVKVIGVDRHGNRSQISEPATIPKVGRVGNMLLTDAANNRIGLFANSLFGDFSRG